MKEYTIDCTQIITREDLHRIFAETLGFPAHYGNNLDALHDCLTALSEDTRIRLLNWAELEKNLSFYALSAKRALLEASVESPNVAVFFN